MKFKRDNQPIDVNSDMKIQPESEAVVKPSVTLSQANPVKNVSNPSSKNQSTVISSDSSMSGEITGGADVKISGNFEGSIDIPNNTIMVEHSGTAMATMKAEQIVVNGKVTGNICGTKTVHIMSTGVVEGDIKTGNIILEKACKFNGTIEMLKETSKPVEQVPERKPAKSPESKMTTP